jgi:serine/threonine protein kinase
MYTGSPQVVVAPAVDWHNPWFIAVFTIFLLSLIFLLLSMIIALLFVSRKLLTIKKRDRKKDNYIVQFHSHLYTEGNFSLHNIEVNGIYLVVALYESETDHYRTQKSIYLTKGIQHDNILTFTTEATHLPKYWLTFKGTISQTLLSHLKSSNIDREMLCLFCHSIASGISHLHRGINGGNVIICHRNINSCSILVRNDLKSCVISDFGCCVKYFKGDLVLKGSCQSGKLRHVAPEVLDNSLDVYNAISVIRSDVYSFGVVMWELFNHLISQYYSS